MCALCSSYEVFTLRTIVSYDCELGGERAGSGGLGPMQNL